MSRIFNEVAVPFQPARRLRLVQKADPKPTTQPARVARQLALAHALQKRLDVGELPNQAALARTLGFSRERIAKILDLLLLAPDIQEEILSLECDPGHQPLSAADLERGVLRATIWEEQRLHWKTVFHAARGRIAPLRD